MKFVEEADPDTEHGNGVTANGWGHLSEVMRKFQTPVVTAALKETVNLNKAVLTTAREQPKKTRVAVSGKGDHVAHWWGFPQLKWFSLNKFLKMPTILTFI